MKRLILLTLLIKQAITACADGCLRCTQDDKCLACENWANYFLSEGVCVPRTLKNCQLISQTGDCLLCAPTFFYDLSVKSCAPVPADFVIANCEVYNSDLSCKYCAAKSFFSSGKCSPIEKEIPSCLYYSSTGFCQLCNSGFAVSVKGDSCISPTSQDANCSTFGPIKCNKCFDTHILNPNYYILKLADNSVDSVNRVLDEFLNKIDAVTAPVCAPKQIPNCKTFQDFYTCSECNDGYFLEPPAKCTAYPKPVLDGCASYASEKTCADCQQGFFLKKPTECAPVITVTNCISYGTNTTSSQCLECKPEYFLEISGLCVQRYFSLNVTNCTAVDKNADKCKTCIDGNYPTDDGQKCLSWPLNCNVVDATNYASVEFICLYCNSQYYLDPSTKLCKLGSIKNCVNLEQYADTCLTCQNKYYLSNNACSLHSEINGCDLYHPTIKNQCQTCKPTSLAFAKSKVCTAVTPVTGCKIYASETTCLECDEGYKLAETTCTAIAKELNCLKVTSANLCIKCKPDFTLDNGICSPVFAFLTSNCLSTNLVAGDVPLSKAACNSCKEGSYPFSYLNHYMCIENTIIPSWTSKTFTNCRQIEYKSSEYVCRKCVYGKYLSATKECVDTCPTSNALNLHIISATSDKFYMSGELFCSADSTCKLLAMNNQPTNADFGLGCAACFDGNVPTINANNELSIQMNKYDLLSGLTTPTSPVIFLPSVTCALASTVVTLGTVTTVEGCEYYYTNNSKNGCIKCKHGYYGTLADSSDSYGYIKTCTKMTSCDDSVFRPGLSKTMNSVLSCHKCVELTKIPFVFIRGGTIFSDNVALKSYSIDLSTPKTATSGGLSIDCLNPASTVSGYILTSLPANCGVGIINVEADSKILTDAGKASGVDRTKIAAFCGACAPGYKIDAKAMDNASTPVVVKNMIPSCSVISNCKSSTWFNHCSQCQDNFAYAYTVATGVQYNNCVQYTTDLYCYAVDISNPLVKTCVYCYKGFVRNSDGFCVKRVPPKCKDGSFVTKTIFPRIDFHTMLFLQPDGEGCNQCEDGYTATMLITDKLVCTQSSYIAANKFPTITLNIANCKIYSVDLSNAVICSECKTDFVLNSSKNICFAIATLKNCLLAYSATLCQVCASNYIVINGLCESKKILRCKTYVENRESLVQACTECDDGYYLNSQECIAGAIKNCKKYGDGPDKCFNCLPGFQLVYNSEPKPYCYPIDPSSNCLRFLTTDFDQGITTCVECYSNLFVIQPPKATDTKSTCMPFQTVENCLEYQISQLAGYSTFKCKLCAPEFFIKDSLCQKRSKIISNCLVYNPVSELCQTCSAKTYISTDSTQCIDFPSGVDGCRLYSGLTTCLGCKTNYYYNFTENRCMIVSSDKIVENCQYYSQYSKCETCQNGFAISSNKTCEQVVAKDCVTYASKNACASCQAGQGIKNETGIFNCVPITDSNCAVYEILFPLKCTECKEAFALDINGICKAVDKIIKGCIAYESATICKRCQPGLVLVQKLTCETSADIEKARDLNCADNILETSLNCATCKGGYWFQNGTCTSCELPGCHFCNPTDKKSCVICQAGHYMDKNGTCNIALYGQANNNSTIQENTARVLTKILFIVLAILLMDM